jgi:branched-chain amino acid transport system substrate-binding protein
MKATGLLLAAAIGAAALTAAPFASAADSIKIGALLIDSGPLAGLKESQTRAITLAKQQAQFGLFAKYKMIVGNSFVIPQAPPAMGDTVDGVYQTLGFTPGEKGAQAEAFVKSYQAKYNGELPAYTAADQYAAIQLMAAAINKANSTDVAAVRAALSGLN